MMSHHPAIMELPHKFAISLQPSAIRKKQHRVNFATDSRKLTADSLLTFAVFNISGGTSTANAIIYPQEFIIINIYFVRVRFSIPVFFIVFYPL
jgi:hypothetical protein